MQMNGQRYLVLVLIIFLMKTHSLITILLILLMRISMINTRHNRHPFQPVVLEIKLLHLRHNLLVVMQHLLHHNQTKLDYHKSNLLHSPFRFHNRHLLIKLHHLQLPLLLDLPPFRMSYQCSILLRPQLNPNVHHQTWLINLGPITIQVETRHLFIQSEFANKLKL